VEIASALVNGCAETLETLEDPPAACREPAFFAQRPDAASQANNQTIELVWQGMWADKTWEVFRAENTSLGNPTSWTIHRQNLQGDLVEAVHPAVTLHGSTVNTLWADDADNGTWRVRGSRSSSAVSGPNAFMPDATAKSANDVYAAYSRINPNTSDFDIYWNKSVNGGVTWSVNENVLLTSPASPSLYPSITYDQSNSAMWVFWREGNGPNWTIRGKRFDP
jgi:hypothetical protein